MITRSPAQAYLTALVLDPNNTIDDVIAKAVREQIFYLSREYLLELKNNPPPPVPFHPRDPKHKRSMMFLLERRVHDFYYPCWELREAFEILRMPRVREIVETMIVGSIPCRSIVDAVRLIARRKVHASGIETFRQAFFCLELIERSDVNMMLDLMIEQCRRSEDPGLRAQAKFMKAQKRRDPRRIAATLPQGSITAHACLGLFGAKANVDVGETLIQIRDTSLVQAGVAAASGSVRDARRAEALMKVASLAQEMRAGVVSPHDEMADELRRFTLRYDEERSKTFDEVCGGNYTTNVMPEERPEQAPS